MSFLDRLSDVSALLCCGPEASGSLRKFRDASLEVSSAASGRGAHSTHCQLAPPPRGTASESGAAHPIPFAQAAHALRATAKRKLQG